MSQLSSEHFMGLKQFFFKSLGKWESHRTYMYPNGKCTYSTTLFNWSQDKETGLFVVSWKNEELKSEGTMGIELINDFKLARTNGYFTSAPTISHIQTCSDVHLRTLTSYDGATYDEEINFVSDDRRIRRTIGTKDSTQDVILIGTYVERKLD